MRDSLVHELRREAEQEEGDHGPGDAALVDAVGRLEKNERAHEDAHFARARKRLDELEPPAYERLQGA